MESTDTPQDPQVRFHALFDAVYLDLLRFVQRRVHPTHAEDVAADVMLIAWRRLDDVPTDLSDARAWVFGVAHKTLQNTHRNEGRRAALAVRLAQVAPASGTASHSSDVLDDTLDVAAAWPRMSAVHQEAIALTVFDGLSASEAAAVLGISSTAFRLRLSRARRSLRKHVESTPSQAHQRGELTSIRRPR